MMLSFTIGVNASADTGPKPSVNIQVEGNTKGMYMTLLSKKESYGPWHTHDKNDYYDNYYKDDELIAHKKVVEYEDKDGFYYWQFIDSIEDNKFNWGYYPPDSFKILIYNVDTDKFITNDEIYQRNEFTTVFRLTLDETSFTINQLNTFMDDLIGFFVRLVICIAIEIIIALFFGFKGKELIPILIVNLITQVLLNVILTAYIYYNGFQLLMIIPLYILFEFLILMIEFSANAIGIRMVDTRNGLPLKSGGRIALYTLVANLVSLIGGFVIITIFENINIYI